MFYIREVFLLVPDKVSEFNEIFEELIFPMKIKSGAKIIGRWMTKGKAEVTIIWEYPNHEEYLKIEERVIKDEMYKQLQNRISNVDEFFIDTRKDYLSSFGEYTKTKPTITVSGYITNENQETLLVKTYWRADTWELPGGGVDEGETLDTALVREILEETGIQVELHGVSGVYSNGNTVSIVFRGKYAGGEPKTSKETKEVRFVKLDSSNVSHYIKRGKFIPRVIDAMTGNRAPYEAFKVRPYELLKRMEGNLERD
ncbi:MULTISPECIES: NUDIX domain-containing protein [Neobacillus]|uniref:NUDIX hydrolase n=1 Tax=Neobacillus rhizophilus TaxID=2833579 RepID=A0A942YWT1_9BACI|nr:MULTISPECIES: NUDIX domain-containing protein [Neobacillus]MBS4216463.1 NUDIX hydrolase [Neobacillus rhizophilus]